MVDRHNIDELITTLLLEPDVKNIVTEGIIDKNLLKWFLSEKKINGNVAIYSVQDIEIPPSLVSSYNLNLGCERSRVITLSKFVENKNLSSQLMCIIDKDVDTLLEISHNYNCLQYTDFSCLEMYYWDRDLFVKFFSCCYNKKFNIDSFMKNMTPILIELFLIRTINEKLELALTSVNFDKYISYNKDDITFDEQGYIRAYLNKNHQMKELTRFNKELEALKQKLPNEPRLIMHGHDFLKFLSLFVEKHLGKNGYSTAIEGGHYFLMGLTIDHINNYPMFQNIIRLCA